MLCANVIERATGAPPSWSHPYEIFTRLGVRIAVIGLITPDTPKVTLPENVTHLDFLDPAPIANRIIAELIPAKADLVIILCHIGCTQERGGPLVGELVDMAEAIEGENVILGGHTHRIITGKVGETVVVESGSLGRWVGRVDLRFDRISRTVVDASTRILTVFADSLGEGSVPPDPDVVEMVAEYREEIAPILDEHVGDAAVELEAERAECPMGNWIADVIREASGSDIALQNPGGVRSPINAGPILYADVYRVMPFDNTIVVARMTGTEVKSYLETIAERKSFLHASGIRYTLDYSKQEGERVTQVVLSDGSALDPAHEYRVAVNNFMAQGGDDLPILQDLPTTTETSILVRDAMISACRAARDAGQALSPKVEGRVTRIPA
jgi:2',3'-cyclic-nucleotide 2'-phosphodiesterase/3'-nucleotidase